MAADVQTYIKLYQTRQACKVVIHSLQGYIRPLPVPEYY